jgi:hypothetical protein
MQKYHMPIEKIVYFSRVKTEQRKEKKTHRRMNRQYHRCIASVLLVHCATTGINLIPSDEPMVPFLVALDELEKRSCEDTNVG